MLPINIVTNLLIRRSCNKIHKFDTTFPRRSTVAVHLRLKWSDNSQAVPSVLKSPHSNLPAGFYLYLWGFAQCLMPDTQGTVVTWRHGPILHFYERYFGFTDTQLWDTLYRSTQMYIRAILYAVKAHYWRDNVWYRLIFQYTGWFSALDRQHQVITPSKIAITVAQLQVLFLATHR